MHSKQSSNPLTKEMNYESCKHAKAAADKIESGVILNNSQQDFRAFKVAPNHTTYLMNSARRDYFSNVIVKTSSNQRKLFLTTSSLLFEPTDVSFLDHIPPDNLANNFGNYFVQKIERINDSLDALQ